MSGHVFACLGVSILPFPTFSYWNIWNCADIVVVFVCYFICRGSLNISLIDHNFVFFNILIDPYTGTLVSPDGDRIYVPATGSSDSDPTCTYCQYTTDPPDSDVRILQRESMYNIIQLLTFVEVNIRIYRSKIYDIYLGRSRGRYHISWNDKSLY